MTLEDIRRLPYRVECTRSFLISKIKQRKARQVLGCGIAWEDLRYCQLFPSKSSNDKFLVAMESKYLTYFMVCNRLLYGGCVGSLSIIVLTLIESSTCGLVAMTSAPHAEGRQFDPGQVYFWVANNNETLFDVAFSSAEQRLQDLFNGFFNSNRAFLTCRC